MNNSADSCLLIDLNKKKIEVPHTYEAPYCFDCFFRERNICAHRRGMKMNIKRYSNPLSKRPPKCPLRHEAYLLTMQDQATESGVTGRYALMHEMTLEVTPVFPKKPVSCRECILSREGNKKNEYWCNYMHYTNRDNWDITKSYKRGTVNTDCPVKKRSFVLIAK
jgi:hypothetical protein